MKGKDWVRVAVTVVLLGVVVAWLVAVWTRLGTPPVTDKDGNVTIDEFARAKDILVLILPLATAVAGYWLGTGDKKKAETEKKAAEEEKDTAVKQREKAQKGLAFLAGEATSEAVEAARRAYPEAWE